MKENESNNSWFPNWEHQLPSPEDLMPITQTLITPDLAMAFDIPVNPNSANHTHNSFDFDSSELNSMAGGPADEPARTLKRPRLVWTPQLHKRFVDAVAHLGIKNAVPKTIMQLMSVEGLTRENVASHLQKYRLYLKRMQGIGGNGGGSGPISAADDRLFASTAVPPHFLRPGAVSGPVGAPEPYLPFVPVAAAMQHQQYFEHQRNMGHFGGGGGFDHGFLNRAIAQPGMHRMVGAAMGMGLVSPPQAVNSATRSYIDELEDVRRGGGDGGARKVLTLFPTADD